MVTAGHQAMQPLAVTERSGAPEEALFSAVQTIVTGLQNGSFSRVLVKNMLMPILLEVYADHELLLALAIAISADVRGGRLSSETVRSALTPVLLILDDPKSENAATQSAVMH